MTDVPDADEARKRTAMIEAVAVRLAGGTMELNDEHRKLAAELVAAALEAAALHEAGSARQ